jgi:tetratricopeptide (TPR) repeat protein
VADSPRIEELKRRVHSDPASIAFAALAEEYRRAGRFDEAIETCNTGLVRHPSYLSAHVTLGRALIEVGRLEDARGELEYVLKLAPENLAAIRGLAEIHHRIGNEARHAMPDTVDDAPPPPAGVIEDRHEPAPPVHAPIPLRVRADELGTVTSSNAAPSNTVSPPVEATAAREPQIPIRAAVDPSIAALESFLNAIVRARAERADAR